MVPVNTISAAVSDILLKLDVNFAGLTICASAVRAAMAIIQNKKDLKENLGIIMIVII
jgi:hypothetical protein